MPQITTTTGNQDQHHVPFNPAHSRTFAPLVKKVKPCAVEYIPIRTDEKTDFGILNPDKVKITLLGPDFVDVSGFEYIVISGDKYLYWKSEPIMALGSIDVHVIWCKAEDAR